MRGCVVGSWREVVYRFTSCFGSLARGRAMLEVGGCEALNGLVNGGDLGMSAAF